MKFQETAIPGAFIVDPERHEDNRGYFTRSFCEVEFKKQGISFQPVQSNISYNETALTLRGMHFHTAPYEETKLVRCSAGRIFDVAVDLRKTSPAFKTWIGVDLSRKNGRAFFIPAGCAHGFLTLENETEVFYQMSPAFTPGNDAGFHWNDPDIAIEWPEKPVVISQKDQDFKGYEIHG
ncbi:MAG: dTDP-4-dehydrorhamnose 3,5-epimerase [Parvibaculaceae bacterium]|nr:dTDP-4-dehydrorhamnose 3,5-epimerase [Parvibaculaceae bacterium]